MKSNINVLGLAEIHRVGEKIVVTKQGNLLYLIGNEIGQKGFGFLIKADINKNKVVELKGIRDRIAMVKIETDKRSLICVHLESNRRES